MARKEGKEAAPLLEREVFVGLARAYANLMGEMEALFAEHGLSEPQFNALRIVRGAGPKGLPTQQIAERLITRQPDVTRLIDRLCAAGLVERKRCDEDRRIVYVLLTPEGRKVLAKLDAPVEALHRRQFGHLSKRQLKELGELLAGASGNIPVD